MTDAVAWVNGQGKLQGCNLAFEALTNEHQSTLVGQSIVSLLPLCQNNQAVPDDQHPITLAIAHRHQGCQQYQLGSTGPTLEIAWSVFIETNAEDMVVVLTLHPVGDRFEAISASALAHYGLNDNPSHPLGEEFDRDAATSFTATDNILLYERAELLLRQQVEKEQLLSSMLLRIRQSLDLNEILQTTVDEVRQFLGTDRVLVFRFDADGRGYVPVESIREERWSVLNLELHDPCFDETYRLLYLGGRVSATTNIHKTEFQPCYINFLAAIEVVANLVVPIIQGDRFLGLLIVHHCTEPRQWLPREIHLLQQLAAQVAIAIHQCELYQQLQTELAERALAEQKLRQSEQRIRDLCQVTASQGDFDHRLAQMLTLGREQFGLDIGTLSKIEGDRYEVIMGQQPNNITTQGAILHAQQTYCGSVIQAQETVAIAHVAKNDWCHHPGYTAFRIEAYIGTIVLVQQQIYGTLCFYSHTPKPQEFTPVDQELLQLMAQWIGRELEQQLIHQDLAEARDRAMEATQLKSEFLATMSHEIRTPLNAIMGMTRLLLDTPLDTEQRHFTHTIGNSSDTLLTIINEILDFSKIESGTLELETAPLVLRTCIEDTCDWVAEMASRQNIELAYYIAPNVPTVILGDLVRLRQVLVNLVNNAVKFTPQGEVIISVSAQVIPHSSHPISTPLGLPSSGAMQHRLTLESGIAAATHELQIKVQDTGIGMAPAQLSQLFKPFIQADVSTTRQYGGTGLGLSICQKLVTMMQGQITVQSQEGQGSTFQVSLPVVAVDSTHGRSAGESRAIAPPPSSLRHKQVLIVEDNLTHGNLLARQLTEVGMVAHTCTTPQDALDFLYHYLVPDLVLLDVNQPKMDELKVAHLIHHDPALAPLPIVALTPLGYSTPITENDDTGIVEILSKPIKYHQLIQVIEGAIAKSLSPESQPTKPTPPSQPSLDHNLGHSHPLRILIAEDNRVNQRLQEQLLRRLGYASTVVSNGMEATKAIEHHPYDVVLMDVHMPEMDGLKATEWIRQTLPPHHQPRIIAVTASAMEADLQRCLGAGMDEFLSKPIRIEALTEVLQESYRILQSTPKQARIDSQNTVPTVPPPSPTLPPPLTAHQPEGLDWSTLRQAAELVHYDHGFMADLMTVFLKESQTFIDQMQAAIATQEFDSAYRAAHTLKSSSASLGALRLAELCKQLERHLKTASRQEQPATQEAALWPMYDQLKQEYSNVYKDIVHYQNIRQIPDDG
ncbi:MAG: response regulator [Leptolyngbyaceae bacterium]|nr:response regulator [Leptolyngbyaceae bacterium]